MNVRNIAYQCGDKKWFYHAIHRKGLLVLCDILGFGTFIENNPHYIIDKTIVSIICNLKKIEEMELNKILNDGPLKNRDNAELKDLKFNYSLISDTFIIYPNKDFNKKTHTYENQIILSILTTLTSTLFAILINDFNMLIRGSIVYNEYQIIMENNLIYGKAIIEAYNNESMQKWGGIIPSETVSSNPKNKNILTNNFVEYDIEENDILKNNYYSTIFLNKLTEKNTPKYVLDWIRVYKKLYKNEPNWDTLFNETKKIKDKQIRDSANKKISNTKNFYNWYIDSFIK